MVVGGDYCNIGISDCWGWLATGCWLWSLLELLVIVVVGADHY